MMGRDLKGECDGSGRAVSTRRERQIGASVDVSVASKVAQRANGVVEPDVHDGTGEAA